MAFWSNQLPGIAGGEKILFVGDDGEKLLATVLLMFAPQPNAPHRAEIGKMLVHSSMQRQGLRRAACLKLPNRRRATPAARC